MKRPSAKRMLQISAAALLLAGAGVGGGWIWLQKSMPARVEKALESLVVADVSVAEAHFSLSGTIEATQLQIRLPSDSDVFLEIPHALIQLDKDKLYDGQIVVAALELNDVSLILRETAEGVNLNDLCFKPSDGEAVSLPEVTLSRGTVTIVDAAENKTSWPMHGSLQPHADRAGKLSLSLQPPANEQQVTLEAELDLHGCHLSIYAEHIELWPELAVVLPADLREWMRSIQPGGRIPSVSMKMAWQDNWVIESATARLEEGSLTPRLDQLLGDVAKTPLGKMLILMAGTHRADNISGDMLIKDNKLFLENLTSRLHASALSDEPLEIHASGLLSLDDSRAWSLRCETSDYEMRENIPLLSMLPFTQTLYQRFKPSGEFRLSAMLASTGIDQDIDMGVWIDVLDAKTCYEKRPYPAEKISGRLHLTQDTLKIESLQGLFVHGGEFKILGEVTPLTDEAGADLAMQINGVPIKDPFVNAMSSSVQKTLHRFFDITGAKDHAQQHDLPPISVHGAVNGQLQIQRSVGVDGIWNITATLDPSGAELFCKDWPYPMHVTSGSLQITETEVRGRDIIAKGPTGGQVRLQVDAADTTDDGVFGWVVRVLDGHIPVDDWFLASLPANARKSAQDIGAQGDIKVQGSLGEDELIEGPEAFNISLEGTLRNGTANPYNSGLILSNLVMPMYLTEDRFEVLGATATRGEGQIKVDSHVDWSKGTDIRVALNGESMPIEPIWPLLANDESESRVFLDKLFKNHQPSGNTGVSFEYTQKEELEKVSLAFSPQSVQFTLNNQRHSFQEIGGSIHVSQNNSVRLDEIQLRWPRGHATLNGSVSSGGICDLNIGGTIDTNPKEWPALISYVLGSGVKQTLHNWNSSGTLSNVSVHLRHTKDQTWHLKGSAHIEDGILDIGVPLTSMTGLLRFNTSLPKTGSEHLPMDWQLALEFDTVQAWSLPLTNVHAKLLPKGNLLCLQEVRGDLADGVLTGQVWYRLDDQRFAARADITDAQYYPLVLALGGKPQEGERGLVNTSLALSGGRKLSQMRGEASCKLSDAEFGNSDGLNTVKSLNLLAADSRGFQHAWARISLLGENARIEDLYLEGNNGLRIAGGGDLHLGTKNLDLHLASSNTSRSSLRVLVRLLNPLTNELLGLRVRGTLDKPRVETVPFVTVRSALMELLPLH